MERSAILTLCLIMPSLMYTFSALYFSMNMFVKENFSSKHNHGLILDFPFLSESYDYYNNK